MEDLRLNGSVETLKFATKFIEEGAMVLKGML
jgi:hypothetical protein